jgi:hypothetical protein
MVDDTDLYVALDRSFCTTSRKVASAALAVGRREAAQYRLNGWQVMKVDDYYAEVLVNAVRKVTPVINDLEEMNAKLLKSLKWLFNLGHGVGRVGGEPENGESEKALDEAEYVIYEATREPDKPECPLCGRTDGHVHHFD